MLSIRFFTRLFGLLRPSHMRWMIKFCEVLTFDTPGEMAPEEPSGGVKIDSHALHCAEAAIALKLTNLTFACNFFLAESSSLPY